MSSQSRIAQLEAELAERDAKIASLQAQVPAKASVHVEASVSVRLPGMASTPTGDERVKAQPSFAIQNPRVLVTLTRGASKPVYESLTPEQWAAVLDKADEIRAAIASLA